MTPQLNHRIRSRVRLLRSGETWMYPALLLWHPKIAQSLLQYRINNVQTAERKALSYNKSYTGAMFPWESAATGSEVCPSWASTGQLEQHITGDIAIAAQQFWYATNNRTWLRLAFPGLLKETAQFWTSRVEWEGDGGSDHDGDGDGGAIAHINHVIPPDEYATGNDSVYTNYVSAPNHPV
jgi:trehalose/maltose hydrolase-like predicted phosphorylase